VRQTYPGFDADVYKLLQRYFSHHPNLDWLDLRNYQTAAVHWA
jgi:hypothetical protein